MLTISLGDQSRNTSFRSLRAMHNSGFLNFLLFFFPLYECSSRRKNLRRATRQWVLRGLLRRDRVRNRAWKWPAMAGKCSERPGRALCLPTALYSERTNAFERTHACTHVRSYVTHLRCRDIFTSVANLNKSWFFFLGITYADHKVRYKKRI